MLDAAVGLITLDSDLQSSGASTSTSPPDSDSDCDRPLVSRPLTKGFNALKFEEQCFHFKEYLRSPDTFRTYHTLWFISRTNRTSRRNLSTSHRMNTGRNCSMPTMTNSTMVNIFFLILLLIFPFIHWILILIFARCMTEKT